MHGNDENKKSEVIKNLTSSLTSHRRSLDGTSDGQTMIGQSGGMFHGAGAKYVCKAT
jgi:hypothetical protein